MKHSLELTIPNNADFEPVKFGNFRFLDVTAPYNQRQYDVAVQYNSPRISSDVATLRIKIQPNHSCNGKKELKR